MKDSKLTELQRQIVLKTQKGLPLSSTPFNQIAEELGISLNELLKELKEMKSNGAIRRIGAVPNHYKIGYTENAMTVWDIPDEKLPEAIETLKSISFISHCYKRPRFEPDWPYNIFAMIHGQNSEELESKYEILLDQLKPFAQSYNRLLSTRILKKTGLRIAQKPEQAKQDNV